jgi:Zn-dependent metalloprotease
MHRTLHRHQVCTIVPPYVLRAITASGDAAAVRAAEATIAHDEAIRILRAYRAPGPGAPAVVEAAAPHKDRTVADARNTMRLPGTTVREEGDPATGDDATDEAYDGTGATFDVYWDEFERDSIDDAGLPLHSTVHYGNGYDNAFWDGSQMIFGDGDGIVFNRFTIAVDVIGHELTHGVTDNLAALVYQGQSGALNESVSDVFGSIVKQHGLQQTAAEADWLIGAGLLVDGVNGVALRSMKAPGTAYDDAVLGGKDPQPATMADYVDTSDDEGGVHINSGIPNHAFYLAATAFGGSSWERAGKIWYATLADPQLSSTSTFAAFAARTVAQAATVFDASAAGIVRTAWADVGLTVR